MSSLDLEHMCYIPRAIRTPPVFIFSLRAFFISSGRILQSWFERYVTESKLNVLVAGFKKVLKYIVSPDEKLLVVS